MVFRKKIRDGGGKVFQLGWELPASATLVQEEKPRPPLDPDLEKDLTRIKRNGEAAEADITGQARDTWRRR